MWKTLIFLLTAFTVTVWGQDPTVMIVDSSPVARERVIQQKRDKDVTIDCFVENKPQRKSVRWQKVFIDHRGSRMVMQLVTDTDVMDNTKNSMEKPTLNTWRLRIKAAQVTDEGNYTCFVQTTRQNRKEANMTVQVAIPPYFDLERTSSDMVVKQGDDVELLCNATGRPTPIVSWRRSGGGLLPVGKERLFATKMEITNIRSSDRGVFKCEASNIISGQVERITRKVKLDVQFPPIINVPHKILYQARGYRMELQCLIEANPLPSDQGLKWFMKSTNSLSNLGFSTGDRRRMIHKVIGAFNRVTYELIIKDVKKEDYGKYQCQITNQEGVTMSEIIELIESDEPHASIKLGKVIAATTGAATRLQITIATLIMTAMTLFFHKL